MADGLRQTGDLDGAMAAGQQALDLAGALGDSDLQVQTCHRLGQVYAARGDFGRAAELLRRNVEGADWQPGTPGTLVRLHSQAWLAWTLSVLGAFAEGRRHGEEALRLAMLAGRGSTPIVVRTRLGHLYLAQGDLEPAIRVLDEGLVLCRASGDRNSLRLILAGLGYASALQGRLAEGRVLLEEAISESIRTGARNPRWLAWLSEVCRLAGRDEQAWQHARQALDLARQRKERGTRRSRCTSLASSRLTTTPPIPSRPKPTTSRPSLWPRNSACARSRPIAIAASARCMPRPAPRSRPAPRCPPPLTRYRDMDMTFWLPRAEGALAQAVRTGGQ